MKRFKLITIISLAIVLVALAVATFFYFSSLNEPEEVVEEKPVTEIGVWKSTLEITCPEEGTTQECRDSYEAAVSEVTGLQPDEDFADSLVESLWTLAGSEESDEVVLKTIAGWDPNDKFELSPLFGEEFLKTIKDKDLEYIFIGTPGDTYEATPSDSPYIPITLVSSDQSIIGTFDFSYINFGGAVVPCIKDLCNVG